MSITARTRLLAVIGHPVGHSLSPVLHNAWLAEAGIDGVYLALDPGETGFESLVTGLACSGAVGVNVTVPFKERALRLATEASPAAMACGAANTLIFGEDGSISADNTDGAGLIGDLDRRASGWRARAGPVVLLGTGGAARGIGLALAGAGRAADLRIVARRPQQADALVKLCGAGSVVGWDQLDEALLGACLVINATPRGLAGRDPLAPDFSSLQPDAVVYDTVYAPRETAFLAAARCHGRLGLDGLGMLAGQAAEAFQRWFGTLPDAAAGLERLSLLVDTPADGPGR
jgi:shikimate dehydrogenase